jgi:hypothetical protein
LLWVCRLGDAIDFAVGAKKWAAKRFKPGLSRDTEEAEVMS